MNESPARAAFGPLVSGQWLARNRQDVRIVDVRWYLDGRSGRDAYRGGHIPGAVWLDIDHDLSAPATKADGRHPLPTPAAFAAALGRVGIASGVPVVAYDDAGGSIAARLWWMLHVIGEPVAVLDGGLAAWPGELSTLEDSYPAVERGARAWPPERFASADDVAVFSGSLLDARTAARYAQGDPAIDPRPGHIPGARNMPWAGNLDETSGRFLGPAALRERYEWVGGGASVGRNRSVIAYCGSGVTACHTLLALEVAGITDSALYAGAFSQWGADESRPTEIGEELAQS
jgi:thiosulfate/3-mercaptopyruvate sulfurtransferase